MNSNDRLARFLAGEHDPDAPPEFVALRRQLSSDWVWAEPPVELQESIVTDITRRYAPAPAPSRARWWTPQRLAAIAGVAAAVALAAVVVFPRDDAVQLRMQGTELASGASALATIRSTPSGEDIRLEVEGLPPPPEGSFYQAWVRDGDNAVTIGTFHMRAGDDTVMLWAGVDIDDFPVLTVTLEPDDGDPASSGEVVLRGELTDDTTNP